MQIPTATYRLQFNTSFGFREGKRVIPYLHELGISDIYASPIFKAVKGSTHGYDVAEPNQLNPELGSYDEFNELMDEKRKYKMGWVQDIVPNHTAFNTENRMLMDIFEKGQGSRFVNFFDIAWDHPDKELRGKVLVPVLGRLYKKAVASGRVRFGFNSEGFYIQYYEFRLPVCLSSYSGILGRGFEKSADINPPLKSAFKNLAELSGQFELLAEKPFSDNRDEQIRRVKQTLWELYSTHKAVRTYIERIVGFYNGENSLTNKFAPLESLLDKQYFRLALWKKASERINYRRFFHLNEFIGLRVERPEVFEYTHQLVLRLAGEGKFTGLRLDHIDGLYEPTVYLTRLRDKVRDTYIIVEKILEAEETLPGYWPVQGTTGYEFADHINKVLCRRENEGAFSDIYKGFIDSEQDYSELVYEKKKHIVQKFFTGDVRYLVHLFGRGTEVESAGSTVSYQAIEEALVEIIAAFPVYRTYINGGKYREADADYIKIAISSATSRSPQLKQAIEVIGQRLLSGVQETPEQRKRNGVFHFIMKFQQLTGPAMAKGFEDTVLYNYNRLVSLNEVGSQPNRFGISAGQFHEFNRERAERWPSSLNTTGTHDTKRGEDVRARINILSEIPEEWCSKVTYWREINAGKKTLHNSGPAPDANDEYLIYQMLTGALPFREAEYKDFRKRIKEYMIKALREAKVNSSWIEPNKEYEKACVSFVDDLLTFRRSDEFWRDFITFQKKIASYGVYNSLSQLLIKITSPGIPDFYQGSELWDFNLVDPDNRRPVDFEDRCRVLAEIRDKETGNNPDFVTELLERAEDGRVKMFLIYKLLSARRRHREIFEEGDYMPLTIDGAKKDHIIGFARKLGKKMIISIAPRFVTSIAGPGQPPIGKNIWEDTSIILPEVSYKSWLNVITGEEVKNTNRLTMASILNKFPVSVLLGGEFFRPGLR